MNASRVEWVTLDSESLGISWRYAVYLPRGYDAGRSTYPTLYLLRGAAPEWTGDQDGREGLVPILDRCMAYGVVRPFVVVMPGFMAPRSKQVGAPVNWSADGERRGVGTGRFEEHFFEVKASVEERFRVGRGPGWTAIDGFSMGGYAAVMLAVRHPETFGSVGAYDGSFMWREQIDPRRAGRRRDRLWFGKPCAPLFRANGKWDVPKMEAHNPVTLIESADAETLATLRRIRFHLRTVCDEGQGNVDRTRFMVKCLKQAGLHNTFAGASLHLSTRARHDWRWADIHLAGVLPLHDASLLR